MLQALQSVANAVPENDVNACRRSYWVILLPIWLALIFTTSCTVIRPTEFFALIERFTAAGQESMQRFAVFWGLSWFVVVKGWHFTEFAVLTLLTVQALKWRRGHVTYLGIFWGMLFCIAFAASDEWHQTFVPDRFGTINDVLIDSLGICTAGSILLLRKNSLERRLPEKTPGV